jgi:hypothetical protein
MIFMRIITTDRETHYMNTIKLSATFAAFTALAAAPVIAQESTAFNPETTATITMNAADGFNFTVREGFANMQECIKDMDAEAADFQEMRDTDIIGPNDVFTYACEDTHKIVTATFTRTGGDQRTTVFKP